jgi:hypothetical protein
MGGVRSVGALVFLLRRRAVWVESGAHGGSHRGGVITPTFRVRTVWLHRHLLEPLLKNVASLRSARTRGRDMRVGERGANPQ